MTRPSEPRFPERNSTVQNESYPPQQSLTTSLGEICRGNWPVVLRAIAPDLCVYINDQGISSVVPLVCPHHNSVRMTVNHHDGVLRCTECKPTLTYNIVDVLLTELGRTESDLIAEVCQLLDQPAQESQAAPAAATPPHPVTAVETQQQVATRPETPPVTLSAVVQSVPGGSIGYLQRLAQSGWWPYLFSAFAPNVANQVIPTDKSSSLNLVCPTPSAPTVNDPTACARHRSLRAQLLRSD